MALASNALTTLATVKVDLGLSVSTYDTQLERLINAASEQIERYCGRTFARSTAVSEKGRGYGGAFLFLNRPPVHSIINTVYDDSTYDSTDYEIVDAEAGKIQFETGLPNGAWYVGDMSSSAQPGTEAYEFTIVYDGGWVTPNQAVAISGTPNLTFAATSPATITRSAGSWVTDGFVANMPVTITGATNAANNLTWRVATVTASVLTLAAGQTLTAEGPTASCTAAIVRTLPYDLEGAAIEMTRVNWYRLKSNPLLAAESLGDWSATYNGGLASKLTSSDGLPDTVRAVLAQYRRLASVGGAF